MTCLLSTVKIGSVRIVAKFWKF